MGTDMAEIIERLSKGIEFSTTKDNYELDYGSIDVPFGRVCNVSFFNFYIYIKLIFIFIILFYYIYFYILY